MFARMAHAAAFVGLLSLAGSTAHAAFLIIDDSDIDNITITGGDFEGGLFVDGSLLTTGLGSSNSITLLDGGYTISGSWIDLGLSSGVDNLLFALLSSPTDVTSGLTLTFGTDGFNGTMTGSFGGFQGPPYFPTGLPTAPQDGGTLIGGAPFLSISFISEAAVPEPSTLLLLGGALPLLYLASRRRRA